MVIWKGTVTRTDARPCCEGVNWTGAVSELGTTWKPATANLPIRSGAYFDQLVSTNDLQPGTNQFFNLVQHVFSQLQVLLPGDFFGYDDASHPLLLPRSDS